LLTARTVVEDPLFASVKFHHVGLVISAVFALISVIVAFFLIFKHATHYSKPWEQKQYLALDCDKPP
jgi:predicted membrane chloride channel (bestrophin family)